MEQQLADCESALVEETVVSQERKHEAERCQYQVAYTCSLIFPLYLFVLLRFRAPTSVRWHGTLINERKRNMFSDVYDSVF